MTALAVDPLTAAELAEWREKRAADPPDSIVARLLVTVAEIEQLRDAATRLAYAAEDYVGGWGRASLVEACIGDVRDLLIDAPPPVPAP